MMTKLLEKVSELTQQELEEANKNFPLFHSDHEGISVIREELEEAEEMLEITKTYFNFVWDYVKEDRKTDNHVRTLKGKAQKLACEAIQLAAMCDKFVISKEQSND